MAERIGVVGLGLLGTAIADRLIEQSYVPVVFNRTSEKADALLKRGAEWSDNPFAECQRVIISLYNSDIVRIVLDKMANAGGFTDGQTVIDTTTGSPDDAVEFCQQLAQRNVHYLDAPVSGSSVQTRAGQATIMVGGDQAAFSQQ